MNFYHKIYKAINEGIQKALLIDPNQNDVSINYSYNKISNKTDLYYGFVNAFLQDSNKETYNDLKRYCIQTNRKYKPNGIDELFNVYHTVGEIDDFIDTSDSFTLIDYNGKEIPLHKYNHNSIQFIKLKSPELSKNDNDILIYNCNDFLICETNWHSTNNNDYNPADYTWPNFEKDKAIHDYDGYNNTYHNQYTVATKTTKFSPKEKGVRYNAFMQAAKHSLKNTGYDAYLPALGQLLIFWRNTDLINYVLLNILNESYKIIDLRTFWSSTDADYNKAWCLTDGMGTPKKSLKTNRKTVIPFFKKVR